MNYGVSFRKYRMNKIDLSIPDLTPEISELTEADYFADCFDCGQRLELGSIAALAVKEGQKVLCADCCKKRLP